MNDGVWRIENDEICCELNCLGASIAAARVRDGSGHYIEVALSPESFCAGGPDNAMAGRTVGPCCGRVAGGGIEIDGQRLALARNEGPNHIHGGPHGAALQIWTGEQLSPTSVRFTLDLPDGLDGYPGNRRLQADYALSGRTLRVQYAARTDRPTWLGLTNHVYWDLGGRFDGSALDQQLQIAAEKVIFNGPGHLPEAIHSVEGPFDFWTPKGLREAMESWPDHPQLVLGRGYNNAFLLSKERMAALGCAARLCAPASGLSLRLRTNQPALVLYSGGFLDGDTRTRGGGASPGCAVALEAQHVPDPFHLPGQQPEILRPGETYLCQIEWAFELS